MTTSFESVMFVCVSFWDYGFYFVKWIFEVCVFLFGIIVFTL